MRSLHGECGVITDVAAGNQRQSLELSEQLQMPTRHLLLGTLTCRAMSRSDFGERGSAQTAEVCLDHRQYLGHGHRAL